MPLTFELAFLLLGVLVVLRFITRRSGTNQIRALMMDTKHPAGSKEQLRALFAAEDTKEKARRAELWQEAQISVRAAKDLRQRLQADLDEEDKVRSLVANSPTKPSTEEWNQLQQDRVELLDQIARVDAVIKRLRA